MPSIANNSSSTMAEDAANKSNTINAMLLRAWRERWDDAQWGTHIKTVGIFLAMIGKTYRKVRGKST